MSDKEALQYQKMVPVTGDLLVRDSFLDVTLGLTGIKGQWSLEKAKKKLSHAVEQLLRAAKGQLRLAPPGLQDNEIRKGQNVYEFLGVTLDKVDPEAEHEITKKWLQNHLRGFKTNFRRSAREYLARFPEGEPVDVPTYLKEHGNPAAAERWTEMHDLHGDKFKNQPESADTANREAKTMSARIDQEKLARRMPVEMVWVEAIPIQGYWSIGSRVNDVEMPFVSFEKGTQVFQSWIKKHLKAAQRLTRMGDHPEIQFVLGEIGMDADEAAKAYTAAILGWAKAKTPQQFAAATKKLPGGDLLGALGRAKMLPQSYSDRMISFLDGRVSLTSVPKGQHVYATEAKTMSSMDELEKLAACGDRYKDPDGSFKGGPGDAFDNCTKFMRECRDDVDDPEALCAWIGREHGKIAEDEMRQNFREMLAKEKLPWKECIKKMRADPKVRDPEAVCGKLYWTYGPGSKKEAACGDRYKDPDGSFKGGPGDAFDNCVKYMQECRDDVDDPSALCAWIGREHGKIKAAEFATSAIEVMHTHRISWDELVKRATWDTGHIDEDAELPEGEGSLIPGLEERRGSTIFAFVESCDDMEEDELIVLPGDEMMSRFEEGVPADPCENMSDAECDEWKANTEKYKDKFSALAELERMAGDKTAISQETADFVEWAINQAPMTKNETIRMLKMAGLKEILPPRQKRQGPRFQQKDDVLIKAGKHKNNDTAAPYLENDGKVGVVVGVEGNGVYVQFKSGQPVFFEDAQKTRGVGIYKYTPAFVMQGSKKLELIYESGGKRVNPDRVIVVEQYMGRGKTVKRKAPYFTGHAFNARYNKSGGVYFTLFPQQRIAVNPQGGTTEAGFEATSINPDVGKLYYMGLMGKRPHGWQDELADLQAGSMMMASTAQLERLACDDDGLMSRFEEGVPADPCENMSDSECEEWRSNTEKYKDKFDKSASMGKTAGYTDYWKIKEPFTPEEWDAIKLAAKKAWDAGRRMRKIPDKSPVWKKVYADYVAENGVVLKGRNGSGRPEITDDLILFNGDGSARVSVVLDPDTRHPWTYDADLAHEDFYFINEKGRNFCKTERKPYDMAVASVLWWAKKIAPKKIDIGSDDGNPVKIFASEADKEAAAIADVSERAFNWFRENAEDFEKLPWSKAIDGLGRAISNKSRAEDVLDDFSDLPKRDMQHLLTVGDGEKKLKSWLKDTFKKRGSMDDPLTQKQARPQMLLPKNIRSKIPKLYSQEDNPDPIAWVKFFNPYGRGTWLITEFDGRDTMFGLADLGSPELGYVSLSELEGLEKMPGLQQIERDTSFRPMPLSQAAKKNGIRWSPPRTASKREGAKKKWIPKDLEEGRCTPAPNPDCPVGSPQYNLAQTFKKHHGWKGARDRMTQRESAKKWIPKDLEEGRCTPAPNPDCPVGSPQYNLAQTFKKHPEWGEKGGKKARERLTKRAAREPGGMYGFPKKIQADCESASRKLAKAAVVTAKHVYAKDPRVAKFLATHAERSGSLSAKILVATLQEMGPKFAAEVKKQARLEELRAERGVEAAAKPGSPEEQAKMYAKGYRYMIQWGKGSKLKNKDPLYVKTPDQAAKLIREDYPDEKGYKSIKLEKPKKTAGKAKYGLYGFKAKTANLGLLACNSIREEAGRIASDLHARRADKHAHITEFLKHRSKRGRCLYSRMLVRSYPDADMKIASVKPASVQEWLAWED